MADHTPTARANTTTRIHGSTRWRERAALMLVAVALLLGLAWWLRAPLHGLPLERDEGAYATIAGRWLAGDVLYRDLFDHKPPLVYLVFGLARLLPGDPVRQIRALATLYLLATGLATLALGWRLYGRLAGLAALALLLAYGSSTRFQGLTFNTEAVLVLPALAGCLLAIQGMRAPSPAVLGLAGACVGLAIAAKPIGVALLGPLALAAMLAPARKHSDQALHAQPPSSQRRGALLASALLGALVPLFGFGAALWLQGALPAAYEALVVYNRLYAAESLAQGWDPTYLWRIWAPMLVLALPALAGLAASLARSDWRAPAHVVAALWGLALLTTAVLSLRAYPHYYLATVPLLAVWAGAGIVLLTGGLVQHGEDPPLVRDGGRTTGDESTLSSVVHPPSSDSDANPRPFALAHARGHWIAIPVALAVLAGLLAPPLAETWPLRAQTPYEQIGSLYGPDGYAYFGHADKVAGYIEQHAPSGAPIFVWAAEPEIYFLSGHPPATRFVYDYPIERLPGGRDQLLGALRRAPPALIVTYHDVRPMGFDPYIPDYGYKLRATIGGFDVYGRADNGS